MNDQKLIVIPSGSILHCHLPKKKGSPKRWIMNIQANLIKKIGDYSKLLNHTAMIEKVGKNVLVWEASVFRGVAPTALGLYQKDVFFFITSPTSNSKTALNRIKAQSGKRYDVGSWIDYAKFLITGKWKGDDEFSEYSEQWFCSEIVDHAYQLTNTPYISTPNHVYEATKQNEIWSGTYAQLCDGIAKDLIQISIKNKC